MTDEIPRARDLPVPTEDTPPGRAETVVVGGGIAGAAVLHHLTAAGVDAVLLERDRVGGGATGAAVGIMAPPLRQPFHETAARFGVERATAIWRVAIRSMTSLAEALTEGGHAAEAELDLAGGHVLAETYTAHEVERSFDAARSAGLPVDWMEAGEVRERTGGRGFVGGYRLADSGALNPAATARLLARGAVAAGARVVEGAGVTGLDRGGDGLVCRTARGEVRCDRVVYAVHTEGHRFTDFLGHAVVPIRGQALAAEIVEGTVPAGAWSTHWKMNVWRRSAAGRLHLGGWRHDAWERAYRKTDPEVDPAMQEGLLAWFRQAFPEVRLRVTSRWSGIFGWTTDFLPVVGGIPDRAGELVIAGFSGGGLPFAFECGRMVAALARGEDPGADAALFEPGRFVR